MAQASDVRARESGLEILLVGSAGDEVVRALREQGANVESVPPEQAAHAALVGAPDLIVLIGHAVSDGGDAVLSALAAKSATSVTPVVLVRDGASAPARVGDREGRGPVASVSHASGPVLATRVLELASHLTTREGNPALRALFARGRAPKKSGARVIVPSPSALESEGVDTAKIATLPESDPPADAAAPNVAPESEAPAPAAKRKIVPFVPTERYGAIDLPIDPSAANEVTVPSVAEQSVVETAPAPPARGTKKVSPSRRRAAGRSMKIDKGVIEPATSIRPTEVDLLVVGASRAVSTDRYERVTPRSTPRVYLAAALLAAIAIIASAIFLHAARSAAPTATPLHASH